MRKKISLNKLKVQSFVTEVVSLNIKGGDDTYRLQCTAADCSNASCAGGYCQPSPSPDPDPSPGTTLPSPTPPPTAGVCIPF